MGMFSGIGAIVSLGSSLFGGKGEGTSGGTKAVRPEVAATFAEMGNLSLKAIQDREGERAKGQAKTKAIDPASQIVLNMIREEEKKDPKFNAKEYLSFKNLA